MPKALLILLLIVVSPLLLVVVLFLACCALVYFLFSRLCDCIEEFRPRRGPLSRKKTRAGGVEQFGALLSLLPKRGNNHNKGLPQATEPAF